MMSNRRRRRIGNAFRCRTKEGGRDPKLITGKGVTGLPQESNLDMDAPSRRDKVARCLPRL